MKSNFFLCLALVLRGGLSGWFYLLNIKGYGLVKNEKGSCQQCGWLILKLVFETFSEPPRVWY